MASKPKSTGEKGIPTLLLLAMFAVAARYRATPEAPLPSGEEGVMWNAGADYLGDAKRILSKFLYYYDYPLALGYVGY